MSAVLLLPRLSGAEVKSAFDELEARGASTRTSQPGISEESAWYAASGGSISPGTSREIADCLRRLAQDHGFPNPANKRQLTRYDAKASIYLASEVPALTTGEALRDDVWAYLATTLLPDVVLWRFPTPKLERFQGGVRNTFQRLWTRGKVLDRGPESSERWALVETLSEDAMVQIFERASLASRPMVAKSVAEIWMDWSGKHPHTQTEGIMRDAIKLVRLRNKVINLMLLPESELLEVVRDLFARAASGMDGLSNPE